MTKAKVVPIRVPEWVPPGHPHQWTVEETNRYDLKCEALSVDAWKMFDDHIWNTRECTDASCCGPAASTEEGDESDVPVYDPKVPFNPRDWLPKGSPEDWDEDVWTAFTEACDTLPQDKIDEVDKLCWELMLESGVDVTPVGDAESTTSWEKYTEAEFLAIYDAVGDDDAPIITVNQNKATPPVAVLCACDGPKDDGSGGTGKFMAHLPEGQGEPGCAWVAANKASAVPKKPCTCSGPKEDGSGGSGKFPTHTASCPWMPGYKPLSSPSKPSCNHSREGKLFALEGGLNILALASRDVKYLDTDKTDVGVYLYDRWQRSIVTTPGLVVPWAKKAEPEALYIDWTDYSVPDGDMPMVDIVTWMLAEMGKGVRFETACMGGHGRTGTMLAMLLTAQGVLPGAAINRVREHHCAKGIENAKQAEYVAEFYKLFHGNASWRKSKAARKEFDKAVKDGHKNYGVTAGFSYTAPKSGAVKTSNKYKPAPYVGKDNVKVVWSADLMHVIPADDAWWDAADWTFRPKTYPDTKSGTDKNTTTGGETHE